MAISLTINGKLYCVNADSYPADITLNTFIREDANLFGTKFYCLEGGCGVCTVTARSRHPVTNEYISRAVNSCLVLLFTCNGWDIVTIEGLGDRHVGYHPIQEKLANFNGTQCGFCSPGMIMNMFSSLEACDGKRTAAEIEDSFGGNLCRCTGYRPILDAMKSFATDFNHKFADKNLLDIEDLKLCAKIGKICDKKCHVPTTLHTKDDRIWYFPCNLQDILDTLKSIDGEKYILVAGDTGHGVYRRDPHLKHFIDVNNVPELHTCSVGETADFGGNVTLAEMMEVMQDNSRKNGFEYFEEILQHLNLVAHVQVRNIGTIAGNLMLKHMHRDFISDIFLLLTTIGSSMIITDATGKTEALSLEEFLDSNMENKVILKVSLPPLKKGIALFLSYKILPRAQNAHAYVNAGFLFMISKTVVQSSRICYGGINPQFIQASKTSDFLKGRNIYTDETIKAAMDILGEELNLDWVLPDPSPKYRKRVALGLFYKFILKTAPKGIILSRYTSGGTLLTRPLSSGSQSFDTREKYWPVNKPVRKLEAFWQCSGEANYANDVPYMRDEVWAAFVPATRVLETVAKIDPSEALAIPGVIAFYSAKDIPGLNSFVTKLTLLIFENEELFCNGQVKYHSQPVGIILAETLDIANLAAKKVKILYEHTSNKTIPKTSMNQGRKAEGICEILNKLTESLSMSRLDRSKHIQGYFETGSQFHFSLETHTTICIPREDGLLVYPSSHYLTHVQSAIANCLNLREHQVDVEIQRLGGSFGCKISRSNQVAVACALGSWLSHRPVRFVQTIESNMKTTGKRFACTSYYALSVKENGKILSLAIEYYEDLGSSINECPLLIFTNPSISNVYDRNLSWIVNGHGVITDATSHTWTRAPGTLEAIAMLENIMEHIAWTVNMDPVDVRLNNISEKCEMKRLLPDFIKSTEYRERRKKIDEFNSENRWKKRGIAVSVMRFNIFYYGNISACVAIYHFDGTVSISHGGVEIGQGLNTKAAQVAAYTLGIPLEMVNVRYSDSFIGANSTGTSGSIASEVVCCAVQKACDVLLARMAPVRNIMKGATWLEVVQKCHTANINLVAREICKMGDLKGYKIWGLACSEMEVDILTGNFQLIRVDILEDTGESLNPLVDVGQIEGAFVMGLGYWLTERLVYNAPTGELVTDRTWNYKVPGAKDIPIDFRVTLLQKKPNPSGFLRSKATGEMAICLSISAVFALRHALNSARKDSGINDWYNLGAPTTIEEIVLSAGHTRADYKLSV